MAYQIYSQTPVNVSGVYFTKEPVDLQYLTKDIADAFISGVLIIVGHEEDTVAEKVEFLATVPSVRSFYVDKNLFNFPYVETAEEESEEETTPEEEEEEPVVEDGEEEEPAP